MSELVPVEQKQVTFYGDKLTAVQVNDGQIYVALPSVCNALGLNIQAQARRIGRHDVLADGYMKLAILASFDHGETKRRRMGVLRADLVPLWLTGVSAKAVKDDIRPKLIQFQKEAAKVLWEAFQEGHLTLDEDGRTKFEIYSEMADPNVVDAYRVGKLARSHIMLEGRIDSHERQLRFHDQRLEDVEHTIEDIEEIKDALGRLEDVESALGLFGDDPAINDAQASQISQAVKAVAYVLGKRSGRNEFGSVYGELYRKYSISGYKLLPARQFRDAMEWLTEWLVEVNKQQNI